MCVGVANGIVYIGLAGIAIVNKLYTQPGLSLY